MGAGAGHVDAAVQPHEWDPAAQVAEIEALLRDGGWDGDDVVAGVRALIASAELLRVDGGR